MNLVIQFTSKTEGPLHVGTGLSRAGYADRLIRVRNGQPILPGDAVKGAIRGAADRLARWLLHPHSLDEIEDISMPDHPVLRRLFAPSPGSTFYRFEPAVCASPALPGTFSSTAIGRQSGVARDETLRTIEAWPSGLQFSARIRRT